MLVKLATLFFALSLSIPAVRAYPQSIDINLQPKYGSAPKSDALKQSDDIFLSEQTLSIRATA